MLERGSMFSRAVFPMVSASILSITFMKACFGPCSSKLTPTITGLFPSAPFPLLPDFLAPK